MTSDPLAPVRYLDVVLVLLAAPFVLLMELPVLGYVVGGGVWILQRIAAGAVDRAAARQTDYRRALGFGMASSMARSWLVALSILLVGLLAEREDGLTAAILVIVAFTVYLATSLTIRALERTPTT